MEWLKSRPDYRPEMETEYRDARSSEQVRVAEDLNELFSTAGVLLVDAQGTWKYFGKDRIHGP